MPGTLALAPVVLVASPHHPLIPTMVIMSLRRHRQALHSLLTAILPLLTTTTIILLLLTAREELLTTGPVAFHPVPPMVGRPRPLIQLLGEGAAAARVLLLPRPTGDEES